MMNKSLRARGRRVQPQPNLWFPAPFAKLVRTPWELQTCAEGKAKKAKKEPPFPAAFEVDNREASNRVDRSHSVSKEDDASHT
ncbi:MAG: hypothetical protein WCA43_13405, partial [Bradyrhizobium sp.]